MTPFAAIAARWPADALALLDRLWGTDATMAAIRRELRRRTGMAFSGTEVRIAASRPKPHRTTVAPIPADEPVDYRFVRPSEPDRVRHVAPGTFAAKGFRIGAALTR